MKSREPLALPSECFKDKQLKILIYAMCLYKKDPAYLHNGLLASILLNFSKTLCNSNHKDGTCNKTSQR